MRIFTTEPERIGEIFQENGDDDVHLEQLTEENVEEKAKEITEKDVVILTDTIIDDIIYTRLKNIKIDKWLEGEEEYLALPLAINYTGFTEYTDEDDDDGQPINFGYLITGNKNILKKEKLEALRLLRDISLPDYFKEVWELLERIAYSVELDYLQKNLEEKEEKKVFETREESFTSERKVNLHIRLEGSSAFGLRTKTFAILELVDTKYRYILPLKIKLSKIIYQKEEGFNSVDELREKLKEQYEDRAENELKKIFKIGKIIQQLEDKLRKLKGNISPITIEIDLEEGIKLYYEVEIISPQLYMVYIDGDKLKIEGSVEETFIDEKNNKKYNLDVFKIPVKIPVEEISFIPKDKALKVFLKFAYKNFSKWYDKNKSYSEKGEKNHLFIEMVKEIEKNIPKEREEGEDRLNLFNTMKDILCGEQANPYAFDQYLLDLVEGVYERLFEKAKKKGDDSKEKIVYIPEEKEEKDTKFIYEKLAQLFYPFASEENYKELKGEYIRSVLNNPSIVFLHLEKFLEKNDIFHFAFLSKVYLLKLAVVCYCKRRVEVEPGDWVKYIEFSISSTLNSIKTITNIMKQNLESFSIDRQKEKHDDDKKTDLLDEYSFEIWKRIEIKNKQIKKIKEDLNNELYNLIYGRSGKKDARYRKYFIIVIYPVVFIGKIKRNDCSYEMIGIEHQYIYKLYLRDKYCYIKLMENLPLENSTNLRFVYRHLVAKLFFESKNYKTIVKKIVERYEGNKNNENENDKDTNKDRENNPDKKRFLFFFIDLILYYWEEFFDCLHLCLYENTDYTDSANKATIHTLLLLTKKEMNLNSCRELNISFQEIQEFINDPKIPFADDMKVFKQEYERYKDYFSRIFSFSNNPKKTEQTFKNLMCQFYKGLTKK